MRKPIITYTLSACQKCLDCLKSCPTQAISLKNERVEINDKRCIACDQCINACNSCGLKASSADISCQSNYDYNVLLIPSSIYSDCSSVSEAGTLLAAMKRMGFDEVIDISDISGAVYKESIAYVEEHDEECRITSFCPVINALVNVKYPMLAQRLLPIDYPLEIAARQVRKRLKDSKGKVGIFSLCECVGKLTLAKHPYGNMESEIDHALSIAELFPQITQNLSTEESEIAICREGLCSIISDYYKEYRGEKDLIAVTGFDKVKRVLELAEFENLHSIKLLALFACNSGCIGGHYLWGNPFVGRIHMERFLRLADKACADIKHEDMYKEHNTSDHETVMPMKEKLAHFMKVNEQLEYLPNYDCGACGLASCRMMAEEIIEGRRSLNDCIVYRKRGETK